MTKPAVADCWTLIDGRHLYARRLGRWPASANPPLVMVHGLGVSGRSMLPAARLLAADRPVLIPDLPGFGRSQGPWRALDIPALAAALAAWLATLGLERADWLGNSLGCQVCLALAAAWPERARRLVLVGPTIDPAARSVARQLARLLRDWPRERLSLTPIHAWDDLRAGPRRILATLRHALADPVEDRLPLVAQPALVVRGDRDPVAPQAWAERMAAALPAGRLAVLPGAPHAANYSAPRALAAAVGPFLAEAA
ncbi:MAG TPA: alpha/beta fold hydrolase [Herpetosiphonaceae bacterium]|nr:alpha/beta fold hydrolase [Herpetosiphonaceae bacterium]